MLFCEKVKRIRRQFLAFALIVFTLVAADTGNVVFADEVNTEQKNGYQQAVLYEATDGQVDKIEKNYASTAEISSWKDYSNSYFYNQLNSQQKTFYDRLDSVCMNYLVSSNDANYRQDTSGNNVSGYTNYVSYEGLGKDEAFVIAQIFRNSNPQYFFLSSEYGNYIVNGQGYMCIGMYMDMVSGAQRANYRNEFQTVINSWMDIINRNETDLEKEKAAYDLIMDNTIYSTCEYDQSCVSVFLEGKSVCAGYAQAMQLLCNGAGIETIAVTSSDHEWNKVYLYGNWYNVDCTWDDVGNASDSSYSYFNISDSRVAQGNSSHNPENIWTTYTSIPECNLDTVVMPEETVSITGVYIPDDDAVNIRAGAVIDTKLTDVTYECTVIDYDYATYGTAYFPEVKRTQDKTDNWMTYTPSHPGMYGFCWRAYRNGEIVSEYGATHYFAGNQINSAMIYVPDRDVDTLNFGMVFDATTRENVRIQWFLYRPDDNVYEAILADDLVQNIGEWQSWTKKPGRYWIMCRVTAVNNPASSMCWGVEVRNGVVID